MASSNSIDNLILHSVTGGTDDSFVGLKIIGNDVHIYHPECFPLDHCSKDLRKDIVALLRSISIAKTVSTEHSRAYNSHNTSGDFALFSYIWIIKDYLSRGFYVNREKVYQVNESGKINWKKTMQSEPIVSRKNIIFPNITVERKSNIDNLLVEIHKYCVKKSIDYIGWLFNLKSSFIQVPKFTDERKKVYLNAIQQEQDHTFVDEKKMLLKHMKNVIVGLNESSNNKDFVYGVDSYYYIFERMIDSIFGNVSAMSDFYPVSKWQLVRDGYKEHESSKLRPDTIILKDNASCGKTAYILDSKFYRFGFTGEEKDLPETTSIQKQITYGDYILKNTKENITDIYNAFLMPYDKQKNNFSASDDLHYVGFAKSTWKDGTTNHEIIHAFLIDLKHVIHTWNTYNHVEDVDTLIKEIIEKQKEAQKYI